MVSPRFRAMPPSAPAPSRASAAVASDFVLRIFMGQSLAEPRGFLIPAIRAGYLRDGGILRVKTQNRAVFGGESRLYFSRVLRTQRADLCAPKSNGFIFLISF